MKSRQEARLTTLQRIQGFLDANADALGTVNKATSRVALDQAVIALAQAAAKQGEAQTAATSRTKLKDALREELRVQHMQPIAAIAKKRLSTMPLIVDMRLPVRRISDAGLIAAGTAMANAAGQYTQTFLDQQLPKDFIAELQASVTAVQQAVVARDVVLTQVKQATQGVVDMLTIASTDVHVLNALVVKQLKGKTDLLAAWRQAKRVKAKSGVPTGTTKTPAVPPAPAPTPPVAAPPATPPIAVVPVTSSVAPASVPVPVTAPAVAVQGAKAA
ncbi:MAG TPA: hypothetical protein VHE78_05210 [Gemmatimonadaceae bacterium]|nr:hypothetical protein [Gemmatimonadaceae bacterium]